jgi:glycosyltransferase involved in cell wall biosynthesis
MMNQARCSRQTIKSVIHQDCPGVEHLILDRGSTDGTVDIIREYEGSIP